MCDRFCSGGRKWGGGGGGGGGMVNFLSPSSLLPPLPDLSVSSLEKAFLEWVKEAMFYEILLPSSTIVNDYITHICGKYVDQHGRTCALRVIKL